VSEVTNPITIACKKINTVEEKIYDISKTVLHKYKEDEYRSQISDRLRIAESKAICINLESNGNNGSSMFSYFNCTSVRKKEENNDGSCTLI
jgi:hypothetical protein